MTVHTSTSQLGWRSAVKDGTKPQASQSAESTNFYADIYPTPFARGLKTLWSLGLWTLAGMPIIAFCSMIAFLIAGASPVLSFEAFHLLFTWPWKPQAGLFGVLSLVLVSCGLGLVTALLSLVLAIPPALHLALLAPRWLRNSGELVLTLLAGLPSVIVGLIALILVVPHTGLSVMAAVISLTAMSWPTLSLWAFGAVRQQSPDILATTSSLGITDRKAAYRVILPALKAEIIRMGFLIWAKAVGEATAVSFVLGNSSKGTLFPGLFEASNTVTTVILKEHTAAADQHLALIYMLALLLGGLVFLLNVMGAHIARRASFNT